VKSVATVVLFSNIGSCAQCACANVANSRLSFRIKILLFQSLTRICYKLVDSCAIGSPLHAFLAIFVCTFLSTAESVHCKIELVGGWVTE